MSLTTLRSAGCLAVLPVEILQRVATLLSCTEAIALSLTCRKAYEAVNDWLVFEQIVRVSEERRVERMKEQGTNGTTWRVVGHAYASSSFCKTDVFKRYCLANEKANELQYNNRFKSPSPGLWMPMVLLYDRKCASASAEIMA